MAAPGDLGGVELEVLGWRTERGETALRCRLVDGSVGTIPARWTDLPRRVAPHPAVGGLVSPAGWRLLLERLERLRAHRPRRGRASAENGGFDVGTARPRHERGGPGAGGGVGDALPPERQLQVALMLARLLARLVEAERGE